MDVSNKYVQLNTQLTTEQATVIPAMNGRQGDNNRQVFFQVKDGDMNHNLSGQTVQLAVMDSKGVPKVLSGAYTVDNEAIGRFSLMIPWNFYQAAGDSVQGYIRFLEGDTVVSSIPIQYTVYQNRITFTQTESTAYISDVDAMISKVTAKIDPIQQQVTAAQTSSKILSDSVTSLNTSIENKQVALKNGDNAFTGSNTFSGDVDTNGKFTGHQKSYFLNGLAINGGGIFVKDGSNLTGDNYLDNATITGDLTVKGNYELKGHANVMAGLYVEGGINSKDNVDIYGKTVTHGDTVIDGKIDFNQGVNTHSDVNILGNINMTKVREADIYDNGLNGHLVRVGNTVMLRIYGGILYDHPAFTKLLWDIPAGFRPVAETDLLASAGYSKGLIKIFPDGSAWNIETAFKVNDNNGGDGVPYGFGCWVTTDGFPA